MRVPKAGSGPHNSVYAILPPQALTAKVSATTWARISITWQLFPFAFLRSAQHSPTRAQPWCYQSLPKIYSILKEWKPWKSQHLLPGSKEGFPQQSPGSRQSHVDATCTPWLLLAIVDRQVVLSSLLSWHLRKFVASVPYFLCPKIVLSICLYIYRDIYKYILPIYLYFCISIVLHIPAYRFIYLDFTVVCMAAS